VVPNPYVEIRDTAMRQMTSIGKQLGLTPESTPLRWEDYAPMVRRSDYDEKPSGDAGRRKPKPAKTSPRKRKRAAN
jgi:hypothetical protein